MLLDVATWTNPTAATVSDVSGVLSIFQAIVEFVLTQIGKVVSIVMANPLLLIPIGVVMLYTIIATFKRLF